MAEFNQEEDSGRRMDQDFSKEDIRFRAKIITSEYAKKCIDLINQYDFSKSCKVVLVEIISANFDPNAMLARNDDVLDRRMRFMIALNQSVLSMHESDTKNPGLLNVMQTMEDAFVDVISRSVGGKERDAITKIETIGTQHYTGLGGPSEPKRGLEIPWRKQQ